MNPLPQREIIPSIQEKKKKNERERECVCVWEREIREERKKESMLLSLLFVQFSRKKGGFNSEGCRPLFRPISSLFL